MTAANVSSSRLWTARDRLASTRTQLCSAFTHCRPALVYDKKVIKDPCFNFTPTHYTARGYTALHIASCVCPAIHRVDPLKPRTQLLQLEIGAGRKLPIPAIGVQNVKTRILSRNKICSVVNYYYVNWHYFCFILCVRVRFDYETKYLCSPGRTGSTQK